MNYVGVDLHKKTSLFYVVDSRCKKLDSRNVTNTEEELKGYFQQIPKPFVLAVESTYNWYFFVDLAEQYAERVYLADTYELKAFAKRHKKTDKIDARLIATVLQKGFLPAVTIPDRQTRQIRELLRYRMKLVRDRTRNISRLKSLLDRLGYQSSGDFSTYKHLKAIDTKDLPAIYAYIIRRQCEQIIELNKKVAEIEEQFNDIAEGDEDMRNLLTIKGIGAFSAALIKTEIIDISRFRSFNRLCAYAGLAPRVSASGGRVYHGPLNKNRRKNLQWILLENVLHFIRALPKSKEKFERIERRKGYNTARVALARDILKIIYHVLKERRAFYHRPAIDKSKSDRIGIQSVAATAL
jgi:transposase